MYGFPDILNPEAQKFFFDDSAAFGLPDGKAIFYSRKDGLWGDPSTWETVGNGGKFGIPTDQDMVYVRNTVTVEIKTAVCSNLFVSGTLSFTSTTPSLSVMGDIKSVGLIDMRRTGSNLILYGQNNAINYFTKGLGTVTYKSSLYQNILNKDYYNLTIDKPLGHTQFLDHNLNASGSLIILGATLDTGDKDLSVFGTTQLGIGNQIYGGINQSGNGKLLFAGLLDFQFNKDATLTLFDNSYVEFRKGIAFGATTQLVGAIGQLRFTTNNQDIYTNNTSGSYSHPFGRNTVIDGITLTVKSNNSATQQIRFNGTIDGTNSSSKLVNGMRGSILLTDNSFNLMSTHGTYDINTGSLSTLTYDTTKIFTLEFNTYKNLVLIGGDVTFLNNSSFESLTINSSIITVNGTINTINGINLINATLEADGDISIGGLLNTAFGTTKLILGNYNLEVGSLDNGGTITKLGAGNLISHGMLFTGNSTLEPYSFEIGDGVFMEAAEGFIMGASNILLHPGSTLTLKDNDQLLGHYNTGLRSYTKTIGCKIIISGIRVTVGPTRAQALTIKETLTFTNILTGTNSSSWLISKNTTIIYTNESEIMPIGNVDFASNVNSFMYGGEGDQEIKGTIYYNLEIGGAGIKKLMGNVIVTGTYTLSGTATVDLNGFTLT